MVKIGCDLTGLVLEIFDNSSKNKVDKEIYNEVFNKLQSGDYLLNINRQWIVDINDVQNPKYIFVFNTSESEYQFYSLKI